MASFGPFNTISCREMWYGAFGVSGALVRPGASLVRPGASGASGAFSVSGV